MKWKNLGILYIYNPVFPGNISGVIFAVWKKSRKMYKIVIDIEKPLGKYV